MKEIMAVSKGVKPAMKNGLTNRAMLESIFKFVKAETPNCKVGITRYDNFYGSGKKATIFYVAKEGIISKIIKADKENDRVLIGRYLGYPECCIEKYVGSQIENGRAPKISEIYNATKTRPYGLLNNIFCFESRLKTTLSIKIAKKREFFMGMGELANYSILSHLPCSYDCPKSINFAKQLADIYKSLIIAKSWLFVKNLLFSTILFIDDFNFLAIKSSKRNAGMVRGKILLISPWLAEKPFYNKLSADQIVTYDIKTKELFSESLGKSKTVSMEIFSFE
jgi:hypothetical protein